MKHIKDLLDKHIKKTGLSQQVEIAMIIEEFEQIIIDKFGIDIAGKIKALYIKNKILTVACLSTVVVQEVNMVKQDIINIINKKFSQTAINDIRFTV
jgi:predicted nucleic acid-binding Zn ribbon protein